MTDAALPPIATPPVAESLSQCCCRNRNQALANGYIYTNAGCKVHGIRTNVLFFGGRRPLAKEMQIPVTSVRQHDGAYHRIAPGE